MEVGESVLTANLNLTVRIAKDHRSAVTEEININAEIVKDHRSALMIELSIVVKTVWGVFTED